MTRVARAAAALAGVQVSDAAWKPASAEHDRRMRLGRDSGWTCRICRLPLDPPGTYRPAHPLAFEVDHINPTSRGGDRRGRGNQQSAHRACNRRKSNHTAPPPAWAAEQLLDELRDWTRHESGCRAESWCRVQLGVEGIPEQLAAVAPDRRVDAILMAEALLVDVARWLDGTRRATRSR